MQKLGYSNTYCLKLRPVLAGVFAALVSVALVACQPPDEQETGEQPRAVSSSPDHDNGDDYRPIVAQMAVLDWGEETYGEALIEPVPMFFGDVNGDGSEDVLAVIYTELSVSGYQVFPTVFMSVDDEFVPYQTLDQIDGVTPRNVEISFGKITLQTTVHREGDPNCCPTGEKEWTLALDFSESEN